MIIPVIVFKCMVILGQEKLIMLLFWRELRVFFLLKTIKDGWSSYIYIVVCCNWSVIRLSSKTIKSGWNLELHKVISYFWKILKFGLLWFVWNWLISFCKFLCFVFQTKYQTIKRAILDLKYKLEKKCISVLLKKFE